MKVVAIGGSTRPGSSTQRMLDRVLESLERNGAECELFTGPALVLPPYEPGSEVSGDVHRMVDAIREADALVIGSPGYHGSLSGLVKNVLDYLELLRDDDPPYLTDRPVGLVVTAHGWQAAVTTLSALRQIIHALRGWPTPLGVVVNVADFAGGLDAALASPAIGDRVDEMANQLVAFAEARAALRVGPAGDVPAQVATRPPTCRSVR